MTRFESQLLVTSQRWACPPRRVTDRLWLLRSRRAGRPRILSLVLPYNLCLPLSLCRSVCLSISSSQGLSPSLTLSSSLSLLISFSLSLSFSSSLSLSSSLPLSLSPSLPQQTHGLPPPTPRHLPIFYSAAAPAAGSQRRAGPSSKPQASGPKHGPFAGEEK